MKKKTIKLLSLLLASTFLCSLFTGCSGDDQSAVGNDELTARNNALAYKWPWITSDETDGAYLSNIQLNYIDTQKEIGTPVCEKPECEHDSNDEKCFANKTAHSGSVYYYQGCLYYDIDSLLFQSESAGTNEKVLADVDALLEDEVAAALDENELLKKSSCYVKVRGVYGGKLYMLAEIGLGDDNGNIAASVSALFMLDPKSGNVERCADEELKRLIEDKPFPCHVTVSMCGELMIIVRYTKQYDHSEKGDMELYVYNMRSKKILKEWSAPYEEEEREQKLIVPIVNADATFLYGERDSGKTTYTEYNNRLEKMTEFTLESEYDLAKEGEYYYASRFGDNEFIRYNTQTKKTDKLMTDGTFAASNAAGYLGIINGKMLGIYMGSEDAVYALMDVSCFDTGKFEIKPVKGISYEHLYGHP